MMKLAMKKTLAAVAIAAMAMSGTANAAYFTGGSSGDSDLIFSAWDSSAGTGYTLDLGVSLNTLFGSDNANTGSNLLPASSQVIAAAINNGLSFPGATASFNSFVTAAGNPANIMWNVTAAETDGRARVLTTNAETASAADFDAARSNDNIKLTADAFNLYAAAVFGKAGSNNFLNTSASDGYAYAGNWGTRLGGHGLDSANALGDGLINTNLYLFSQTSTDGSPPPGMGSFSQAMTVDGKALNVTVFQEADGTWDVKISTQVAAVPEADTYEMLIAGLGLVCFIALRRRSQA